MTLPRFHRHRDLALLAERAVWDENARVLFVADLHLGKAATFGDLGQPAPAATDVEGLERLSQLVDRLSPKRVVFLGDLFHARQAHAPSVAAAFLAWRERHPNLALTLVRGNHDIRAGDPARVLRMEIVSEPFLLGAIETRHHPAEEDALADGETTILAGHWHPVTRLRGPGLDSVRLRCFVLQGRQIVLPAFGEFTGGTRVAPGPATSLCAIADDAVVFVPGFDKGLTNPLSRRERGRG